LNEYSSIQTDVWRRLKKNRGAVFGMIVIVLALLMAVFSYLLAPDHSPYANRMVLEIGGQKPGYRQSFLLIKKIQNVPQTSFIGRLFSGADDRYDWLPISSWKQQGDSLVVQKFIDEGITERQSYFNLPPTLRIGKHESGQISNPDLRIRTKTFWLGTDRYGRDILSRLIIGVRVSLAVGLITVILSLSIGIFLGAMAGYYGGRIDQGIMWLLNVIWSIPTLLLVFSLTLLLGKGFWQVFIAIGLTMWINVARIVRGQVLAVKQLEYVEAARALGFNDSRIILRHILPNILGPVMVVAASNFASAIVIEAGLSFLGIGVQPPQPSWGLMIKENYNFIITHNPMLALAPGIAIMLLVLAFNLLGNGLRDALNVKV